MQCIQNTLAGVDNTTLEQQQKVDSIQESNKLLYLIMIKFPQVD